MIEYWQVFGIDTIALLILVTGLAFTWFFQDHANWHISTAAMTSFILSWVMMFGFLWMTDGVYEKHAEGFIYKVSIDQGIDNDYSREYYSGTESEKNQIQMQIQETNLNLGKVAMQYGYGDYQSDKRYIALFWDSLCQMYFMPLWIIGLIGLSAYPFTYLLDYLSDEKNKALSDLAKEQKAAKKKLVSQNEEILRLKQEITSYNGDKQAGEKEYNEIIEKMEQLKETEEYKQYKEYEWKIKNLAENRSSMERENNKLQEVIATAKQAQKELISENQKLKAENQKLKNENAELQRTNDTIKTNKTLEEARYLEEMKKEMGM